jgi:methylenetetrahydrofolate dehydrogenase (NADP+)/methenyltetrahydrofolate cyclohydrolase
MDGRALAERIRGEVAQEARDVGDLGLATVLVGDDPASEVYIRHKHRAAGKAGIRAIDHRLPGDVGEDVLVALVAELNEDDAVDGILVQTPLPRDIDEAGVMRMIDPMKDVDGFHPVNAGQLYLGRPTLVPATPLGIMALLAEYDVELVGANAVVVGRSTIVGRPTALLLLHAHATVTVCHTRTRDLAAHTREADVVVVAVGVPGAVRPEHVRRGGAVVDVGQNRTASGIVGDVDPAVAEVAGLVTPVPGGVGPMTIALLLANTVRAARFRRGMLAFPEG